MKNDLLAAEGNDDVWDLRESRCSLDKNISLLLECVSLKRIGARLQVFYQDPNVEFGLRQTLSI